MAEETDEEIALAKSKLKKKNRWLFNKSPKKTRSPKRRSPNRRSINKDKAKNPLL